MIDKELDIIISYKIKDGQFLTFWYEEQNENNIYMDSLSFFMNLN